MVGHQLFMGISLALVLLLRTYVFAECNVCSLKTNLACVSEFNFALCSDGIPSTQSYKCPDGKVCSTVGDSICQAADDPNTVKACQDCFKCDNTLTFACTSVNSFALCLGTKNYSSLYTGTCATNAFCSIDNPRICGTSADFVFATCPKQEFETTAAPITTATPNSTLLTTASPTTTTAPTTTASPTTISTPLTTVSPTTTATPIATATPPSPTNDPTTYCQYIQETGRFPMGSNLVTTCHQYIYCYNLNSVWKGASYVCPGNSYFDSTRKVCTLDVPARCSSQVSSFSLLNINLD